MKMGELYVNGKGVELNYQTAKTWFDKALMGSSPEPSAQNSMGHLYEHGLGVDIDLERAKQWYQKAMEQDFSPAYTNMGELMGGYSELNLYRRAIAFYDFDPRALYKLGEVCSRINDPGCTFEEKQTDWTLRAVEAGVIEAMFNLGEKNERLAKMSQRYYVEAAKWYEQAANKGHAPSILKIAQFYEQGIGVDLNPEKSAQYYLAAAELGSTEAQFKIGHFFLSGFGVVMDYANAYNWLDKAHSQGYVAAATTLAKLYETGKGVTQNYQQAFKLYESSALSLDMEAQYQLGLMYINGLGVDIDPVAGKAWLIQAATKGHKQAHSLTYSPIVNIVDNFYATAVLRQDGSVVTWGNSEKGGSSLDVRDQLVEGVTSIHYGDGNGFVALKEDGSVVAWGDKYSESISLVKDKLTSGVKSIHTGDGSFAALKNDGSVVTWGHSKRGGDSSAVADKLLSGVTKIFTGEWFLAAFKDTGELVIWGDVSQDSLSASLSSGVVDIASNLEGGLVLKADGTIVTWPRLGLSNVSPSHIPENVLGKVKAVFTSLDGLVMLNEEGNTLWWNDRAYLTPFPKGIDSLVVNRFPSCYVGYKLDGTTYSWCLYTQPKEIPQSDSPVKQVVTSARGFAVLKEDGSLTSWQHDSSTYKLEFGYFQTSSVKSMVSNYSSFAALRNDKTVVSWGEVSTSTPDGGENPELASKLVNVERLFAGRRGFYAVRADESVVVWGSVESLINEKQNVFVDQSVVLNPPS
ncbi:MAG: SEL1-like repeat protein [Vibrio sp.]|uniref:hypothetical protein n=1 Tax=Vibrio TaxID=662 RepID=UPI001EB8725E|nr:hypothetical protein [Vibrio sp.]NRB66019.1 SEL1-like repeat protein [Vibrio sp.]